MPEITSLQTSQRAAGTDVLTAAFDADVMWSCLLPDADERQRVMPAMWQGVIDYCLRYGVVYTTSAVLGIAAWTRPGHAHPTFWSQVRTGFTLAKPVFRMSKASRNRFLQTMKQIDQRHRALMSKPHWYLWALGVHPDHQRQGIGRNLIAPIILQSDQTGVPCYLETETEGNVEFYGQQGFEVIEEGTFAPANLKLWFLRRTPS